MELLHIEIENLKTTSLNVRKKGAKDIGDLLPSIRSLGVLQPLLVRPKTHSADCEDTSCQGYEIVAGQRRYQALVKLAEEAEIEPIPCIIMEEGDDAKAIEASLAENIARLPMDEIDQYKAFSALVKEGRTPTEIASQFGITERLVQQRLAIANLINPILTAYRKEEINAHTIRQLTLATKNQQKEWWKLYQSDDYAPQGHNLKEWLFGGADISVEYALFELADYQGGIITDLFNEDRYFDDAQKFWELQNTAIASAKEQYLAKGWAGVNVLDVGEHWRNWEYCKTPKAKGGEIYIVISRKGEVTFHEGFLTEKQAKRLENIANGEEVETPVERPELTKAMQNYLDLHRHSAVRTTLLRHSNIALRLCLAQMISGSELWTVHADPQKANTDVIKESLETQKAEATFSEERTRIRTLLNISDVEEDPIVCRKDNWSKSHDLNAIFAKLLELDDASVKMIMTYIVAETLPCGSAMVEVLGNMLDVNMHDHWSPDADTARSVFFDLLRDKEAINAMLKDIGGKRVADGNISATAKVQKKIITDFLDGTRRGAKKVKDGTWQPRYSEFPMRIYTKRGGIAAVENWKRIKKHYAA